MKRKLLRQMLNEWRANLWLAIELLLVSVVMWFLADKLWVMNEAYNEPRGHDISHCYKLAVSQLAETAPEFKKYKDRHEQVADFETLIERLEARPEVECVSYSLNAIPYNGSNSGTMLNLDTISTGSVQQRLVSPGFIRVFRIHGADGESPEELARVFENMTEFDFLAASDLLDRYEHKIDLKTLYGRTFACGIEDSLKLVRAYQPIRNQDYQSSGWTWSAIMIPLTGSNKRWANEVVVRLRENMDTEDFKENIMKDALGPLRVGNYYIRSVQSLESIRHNFQVEHVQQIINTILVAVFLLINIFLGVLGTFWFRTSQRTSEIALRMSVGATRRDIFNRIIAEGELILLIVTPLAIVADWLMTHYEFNGYYKAFFEAPRFVGTVAITWAVLALMIAVGSFIPARRAMKISPAEALKTD
ncbi:MAG: ABC transporter permease [Duncaniella sp.]|nr:ABC transporter permease [Duncaniella sp.]